MPRRPLSRALAGLAFLGVLHASAADAERIALPGLGAPAQILVDPWGVPHLYAASADDLFFVQGFNAARDRLFQIDLWRRRGLGRLASVFGADFVEQDRAARLFLYRGDMAREWRSYGREAQRIAARFVAGVNAYIDLVGRDPAKLPFEFRHFGYAPEKWQAEDVVRIRSHGLTRNLVSEVSRAIVACHSDLKSDSVRIRLSPRWETKIPEGLDPCIPPEAMRVYTLATQSVLMPAREARRGAMADDTKLAAGEPATPLEGSNTWAVAPGKSATGRAILASDPHRSLTTPLAALHRAPERARPQRHRRRRAGVARRVDRPQRQHRLRPDRLRIDQEDLYVYETRGAGSGRVPLPRRLGEVPGARANRSQCAGRRRRRWKCASRATARSIHRRPLAGPRLRCALGLVRARDGALLRQHRLHARPHLHRVQAGDGDVGRPWRESALCRRRRQHRLGDRRPGTGAAQLGRPVAGARRRALRVGGFLAGRRSCLRPSIRRPAGWPRRTSRTCLPTTRTTSASSDSSGRRRRAGNGSPRRCNRCPR